MSDTSRAYPPPPPPSIPPPVYQAPPGSAVPAYTPPPVSQPPAGYPPQTPFAGQPPYPPAWQQPGWQQPQQGIGAGAGAVGILSQFSGSALVACVIGLATIIAPFVFGYVFFILPIVGLLGGVRAIRAGKLIGGLVALVLNAIGGLLTLVSLFVH